MSEGGLIESLVIKARRGDDGALDGLFREVKPCLEARIRARLGAKLRGRVEVGDVFQETCLEVIRCLPRFEWRGKESFLWWLNTLAERAILRVERRPEPAAGLVEVPEPPAADPSQGTMLRREERFERLERAYRALSPDHRDVIRLARLEGLKLAEVAERMGISVDAVKQLLARALRKLGARLDETESVSLPARSLMGEPEESDGNANPKRG